MRAPRTTIAIMLAAGAIVALLSLVNLGWFLPEVNTRQFDAFTPYFPGLDNLQKHEIFDPQYAGYKKILILGASNADSLGCDGSLSVDDKSRTPPRNVHFTCRIDYLLQQQLWAHGHKDWRVFNLGRTGTSALAVMMIYLLASEVRPDIVINVGGRHNQNRNGDWETLIAKPEHATFVDNMLSNDPTVRPEWLELKKVLMRHGWNGKDGLGGPVSAPVPYVEHKPFTVFTILSSWIGKFRSAKLCDCRPHEVKFYPFTDSPVPGSMKPPAQPYDMGYALVDQIINKLQLKAGHRYIVYQFPRLEMRNNPAMFKAFRGPYIAALDKYGIPNVDLTDYPMRVGIDIYDTGHHTLYGNQKLAPLIFDYLEKGNFLTLEREMNH